MTFSPPSRKKSSLQKGSTLIAIFWIMSILGLAVFTSIAVVKMQANVATAESHGRRAKELAEKGVALSVHQSIKRSDPLLSYDGSNEGYQATYESIATTFGINALVAELIESRTSGAVSNSSLLNSFLGLLLTDEWGMEDGDAELFISSLMEWVDEDGQVNTANGWEEQNYAQEGLQGRPFNRYFKSLEEVELVHGYTYLEAVKPDWKDFFNIWTGTQIDLSTAEPEIISLASLSETGRTITLDEAQLIYESIIGEDGIRDSEDDLLNGTPQQLFNLNVASDTSSIIDRYVFEGQQPTFAKVISKGWSGNVSLTIMISLQGRGNSPQLLAREEIIEYSEYE